MSTIRDIATTIFMPLLDMVRAFATELNIRDEDSYNVSELGANIREQGLIHPPVFNKQTGNGVQGFRRVQALAWFRDNFPGQFESKYPNGEIPVDVIDVDRKTEILYLVDQGQQQGILTRKELYRGIRALKTVGTCSDASVINRLAGILTLFSPLDPATRIKYEGAETAQAKEKVQQDYWRGKTQPLIYLAALPPRVEKAWFETQDKVSNRKASITNKAIRDLYTAWKKDLDKNPGGKVTREKPGKEFLKGWKLLLEACANQETAEPKKKAMSRTAQMEMYPEFEAAVVHRLLDRTTGEKEVVEDLPKLARLAYIAEVTSEDDPEYWAEVEKRFAELNQVRKEKAEAEALDEAEAEQAEAEAKSA
jgi:hypothetical protein